MSTMSPAEYLAALLALEAGLKEQIGAAKRAVLDRAQEVDAERFKTPYGPVTVATRKGKVGISDPDAFLAWVKEHRPDEVVVTEQVRESYVKSVLEDRLVVMRGEVFDSKTGEPVEWATLGPDGNPYTTWTASEQQKEAKETARALFRDHGPELAVNLRQITTGEEA